MNSIDLVIIIIYVLSLFAFGIWIGIRETAEDFLVLSRRAGGLLVLFSIVSSWVGVGVIVGTAAAGFDSGISFALTGALGGLVAVGSIGIFAPRIKKFGDKFGAHTLGDFFGIRYSPLARGATATIISGIYLIMTAVQFVGLASLLRVWGGVNYEVAVMAIALTTVIYTSFAGIKSDFYTDVVHFCVMALVLVGILLPMIFIRTEGFASFSRLLPDSYFDPFAFGGVGYFAGGLLFGIGVVLVSMELWQRIYASTSGATARKALMGSALIVIPFYAVAAASGMAVRILEPGLEDRNLALFVLMKHLLPSGILGLGVAAFIAVFISSVNTMMMVVSATLTKDVYRSFIRTDATEVQMLRGARICTLIAGLGGLLLSYLLRDILTLSVVAFFMLLIFLPSVIGGFYWRRSTAKGAVASILVGFCVTFACLPFMPTTAFVPAFLSCTIVFVVVSILTNHSTSEHIIE